MVNKSRHLKHGDRLPGWDPLRRQYGENPSGSMRQVGRSLAIFPVLELALLTPKIVVPILEFGLLTTTPEKICEAPARAPICIGC